MPGPSLFMAASAGSSLAPSKVGAIALASTPNEIKARKASEDFEAMFLEQMLERVFASNDTEGPLGENGQGGGVYRSMLVKEHAGSLTKRGGVGIADAVYREMLRLQEGSHARRI